jgi:hypothetical protein
MAQQGWLTGPMTLFMVASGNTKTLSDWGYAYQPWDVLQKEEYQDWVTRHLFWPALLCDRSQHPCSLLTLAAVGRLVFMAIPTNKGREPRGGDTQQMTADLSCLCHPDCWHN